MTGGPPSSSPSLELKRTAQFSDTACCACGGTPKAIELDFIDAPRVPDCPDRFDYMLYYAPCDLCDAVLYFIKLYVVPEVPEGRSLQNDNCWEGDGPERYTARLRAREWKLYHYSNMREVSFEGPRDSKVLVAGCAWLDYHEVGPFIISAGDDPADALVAIAAEIQPAVLGIKW